MVGSHRALSLQTLSHRLSFLFSFSFLWPEAACDVRKVRIRGCHQMERYKYDAGEVGDGEFKGKIVCLWKYSEMYSIATTLLSRYPPTPMCLHALTCVRHTCGPRGAMHASLLTFPTCDLVYKPYLYSENQLA